MDLPAMETELQGIWNSSSHIGDRLGRPQDATEGSEIT